MTVESLLVSLANRSIRLFPDGNGVIVRPASKLTDADRQAIRDHKAALLAWARAEQTPRDVVPDSRRPLIPPEVRAKIEAIESEARRLGWPAELLWNAGFWDCPRGLAALLDADDQIVKVEQDQIDILKIRRDLLRFQRHTA